MPTRYEIIITAEAEVIPASQVESSGSSQTASTDEEEKEESAP